MKKTQVIELFKNIKKTLISFVSITMFVALGVSIFLGLSWTGKSFKKELNVSYDAGKAHDLEVFLPYGIEEEDLNKIKQTEGIDECDAYFCAYENFEVKDLSSFGKIVSISETVDTIFDLEGSYPSKDNEILVERGAAKTYGIEIGDEITFSGEEGNYTYLINGLKKQNDFKEDDLENLNYHYLKEDTFQVVGICESPETISISGTAYGQSPFSGTQVYCVFFVNYEAFDKEVVDGYNYLLIRNKELRNLDTFSNEYIEKTQKLNEELQDVLSDLSKKSYENVWNGYQELSNQYDNELKQASESIEQLKVQIEEGESKLAQANKVLQSANTKLEEASNKIESSRTLLNQYEAEYQQNKKEFDDFKNTIEAYEKLYNRIKEYGISSYTKEEFLNDFDFDQFSSFINKFENNEYGLKISTTDSYPLLKEKVASESLLFISSYLDEVESVYSDVASFENKVVQYSKSILFNSKLTDEQKLAMILFKANYEGNKLSKSLNDIYEANSDTMAEDVKELVVNCLTDIFETKLIESNYKEIIEEIETELKNARAQIDAGWNELNQGINEYNASKQEYERSLKEYNEGLLKLKEAKEQYPLFVQEYEEGKEKYELFLSKESLIKDYGTIVLTRQSNAATVFDRMLSDIIIKVKTSLGGLFLLIGILVCYSVITRTIHDQIKQIGTKKALGLMKKEIILSYLSYTGLSVSIGGLLGLLIAWKVIEPLLCPTICLTFTFDVIGDYFSLKDFIYLFGLELLAAEIVTYLGCANLLNKSAITLLQGEQPGKENHFYTKYRAYQKLSLLSKTIIDNFMNDSRRVIATLIGITSCTALIVCALSLKNNVVDSFNAQFNECFHFDSMVFLDLKVESAQETVEEFLNEKNLFNTAVSRQFGYTFKENSFDSLFTYLMVYDETDENFEKIIHFETSNGQSFQMGDTMFGDAVKEYANLKDSETISYESLAGNNASVDINKFYHYYYYSPMLFISSSTYQEVFQQEAENNVILVDLSNVEETIKNELKSLPGVSTIVDYKYYVYSDVSVFLIVANAIVGIYTIAAILLSIFVLLNLYVTFVEEKKKELIVLMINGFSLKQARRYIYSDTILLTILGVILGIGVGILAGDNALSSFESIYMYLNHKISLEACAIGAAITIVLSFVMSCIALNKIQYFKLTDINKDS